MIFIASMRQIMYLLYYVCGTYNKYTYSKYCPFILSM